MPEGKILVVDDEKDIRNLVSAYLEREGYRVFEAANGSEAIQIARATRPDIIVLDIMLPAMSGLEVLSTLRSESDVYVIMLTAKTEEVDKIVGLNMGADDYLTKPFSPRELVARINAALRRMTQRSVSKETHVYRFEHVVLDSGAHRAWVDGEQIEFTAIEFDLLMTLMAHAGQVLTRDQLLKHVWGGEYFGDSRVVDVHIGHLRKKLNDQFIETVWGVGYRFEDEQIL